jgi:DNA repair photolyase
MTEEIRGTKEWSTASDNFQIGCEHGCKYCYALETMLRYKRIANAADWTTPRISGKRVLAKRTHVDGTVMLPTTHDITPLNINQAVIVIRDNLRADNKLLIVSKPHLECIKRLCDEFKYSKSNILFRFTIGTMDERVAKFWEPGAPSIKERLEALAYAFDAGFNTSVSAEPFFDRTVVALAMNVLPLITDALWIGKMNNIDRRVDTTGWTPEQLLFLGAVKDNQTDEAIHTMYNTLKEFPKIKWKESIKKVVGLPLSTVAGEDK